MVKELAVLSYSAWIPHKYSTEKVSQLSMKLLVSILFVKPLEPLLWSLKHTNFLLHILQHAEMPTGH